MEYVTLYSLDFSKVYTVARYKQTAYAEHDWPLNNYFLSGGDGEYLRLNINHITKVSTGDYSYTAALPDFCFETDTEFFAACEEYIRVAKYKHDFETLLKE